MIHPPNKDKAHLNPYGNPRRLRFKSKRFRTACVDHVSTTLSAPSACAISEVWKTRLQASLSGPVAMFDRGSGALLPSLGLLCLQLLSDRVKKTCREAQHKDAV